MSSISERKLKQLLEAAIFVAEAPISVNSMKTQLLADYDVSRQQLTAVLAQLQQDYQQRGVELVQVASGYRFQARAELSSDLLHLVKEKQPRYSKALLETLALIAYRQPITRGDIEDIRGVAISSQIIKTLLERNWVKVIGHKEVPGRPALYATTAEFLDYFSLSSLAQLPALMPIAESSPSDDLTSLTESEAESNSY